MGDSLDALKAKAIAFRDARNWKQFHKPKDLAAALCVEAAELQEIFLWKSHEEAAQLLNSEQKAKVEEEAADVFLFLIYLAEASGIDLLAAAEKKLQLNEAKYPVDKSYGVHTKYSEL